MQKVHFKNAWPLFSPIARALLGTDLPSAIAAEFGVATQTVRDWRRGHYGIPRHIAETARQRLRQRQHELSELEPNLDAFDPGPGTGANKRKTPAT